VIFYGEQDAEVFLSKLQEIRVNDLSLRINMTRFGRDSPKPPHSHQPHPSSYEHEVTLTKGGRLVTGVRTFRKVLSQSRGYEFENVREKEILPPLPARVVVVEAESECF
jgi:hypothetical protein